MPREVALPVRQHRPEHDQPLVIAQNELADWRQQIEAVQEKRGVG